MNDYSAGIIFAAVIVVLFLAPHGLPRPILPAFAAGQVANEFRGGSVLFGGDVMLGRGVEGLIAKKGAAYPFAGIQNILSSVDVAVANFEAAVPAVHSRTPNGSFRLSVDGEYLKEATEAGFDVFSLANNHAYDFGAKGFSDTRAMCNSASVLCVGDPRRITDLSTSQVTIGTTHVGILAIHAVAGYPDEADVHAALQALDAQSDVQVVYIHWGEEYQTTHNETQEAFAHRLIDLGADAVIGHHPHVVQDIEMYKNKPIFYSLGNLIFDQYLSDETETGLMVKMDIKQRTIAYTLVPVTSLTTPSQPHLMDVDARDAFVRALAERSADSRDHLEGAAVVASR